MNNTELIIGYAMWVIVIGLILGFFNFFSKKYSKLGSLILFVLIPTWLIIAVIKGLEYKYYENSLASARLWRVKN